MAGVPSRPRRVRRLSTRIRSTLSRVRGRCESCTFRQYLRPDQTALLRFRRSPILPAENHRRRCIVSTVSTQGIGRIDVGFPPDNASGNATLPFGSVTLPIDQHVTGRCSNCETGIHASRQSRHRCGRSGDRYKMVPEKIDRMGMAVRSMSDFEPESSQSHLISNGKLSHDTDCDATSRTKTSGIKPAFLP